MKRSLLFLVIGIVVSLPLQGQTKAVHFKKLQEFLPSDEIPGFERKKPTGQTQTSMGMTTSEAKVRYVTKGPEGENDQEETAGPQKTIEVTISDMAGIPFGSMAAMAYQQDFENETEDGHEKSVVVNGSYKGKETAHTGEYRSCELEFAVGGRFVVKMQANNTDDVKLLHSLTKSMNLAKLEKTTP